MTWMNVARHMLTLGLAGLLGMAPVARADLAPPEVVEVKEAPAPILQGDVGPVREGPNKVYIAQLENAPIIDAIEQVIVSRLDEAEEAGAPFVLILDTPGGAVDTTRSIVSRILDARVPVIVWVGPPGSRAGSAGVFITMAGHIAAMAPGTNIGAAHPIGAGVGAPSRESEAKDGEGTPDQSRKSDEEVLAQKIENDLVAFAEAIALARHRNVEWAIQAVRDSASVPSDRALELGVIDRISPSLDQLLLDIDGQVVTTSAGAYRLHTAGAIREIRPLSLREKVQTWLGNPNVAYMLLSLGVLGIALEMYHPGMMIGGIVGGICLVLGAASGLPFSAAGLLLLAAAGILFVLEVYITSFGLLAIAGTVCLVLGGIFLFEVPPDSPDFGVSALKVGMGALSSMAVLTLSMTAAFGVMITRALRRKPQTGSSGMVGLTGEVTQDFEGGKGKVLLRGEFWNASSTVPLTRGQGVRVVKLDGLTAYVEPDKTT